MEDLTRQQYRILSYIFRCVREKGRPPTFQMISDHFGFSAVRAAQDHVAALVRKGYLARDEFHRGIELNWDQVWQLFGIPILGRVPAGTPRLADAEFLGVFTPDDLYPHEEGMFALEVQGDSMTGAGIFPGDYVFVREQPTAQPGEIVVARLEEFEEEVTVKRLAQRGGKFYLEPANEKYEPIELDGGRILGRVIQVVRKL